MQAAETSYVKGERARVVRVGIGTNTYTEFGCEEWPRLCQPISGKDDVRLSRGRLWQLEKNTRSLCQRLSHVEYDILQVVWKRAEIVPLVQLLGSC